MMRPFGLAAFGAFGMRLRGERVMGPAHVAARRRGFSFGHRHGGKTPKTAQPTVCRGQQGGVGSGKTGWIQAKSQPGPGIKGRISTL
jgi:hypothetical protein